MYVERRVEPYFPSLVPFPALKREQGKESPLFPTQAAPAGTRVAKNKADRNGPRTAESRSQKGRFSPLDLRSRYEKRRCQRSYTTSWDANSACKSMVCRNSIVSRSVGTEPLYFTRRGTAAGWR
jgi:hypothetical protein